MAAAKAEQQAALDSARRRLLAFQQEHPIQGAGEVSMHLLKEALGTCCESGMRIQYDNLDSESSRSAM